MVETVGLMPLTGMPSEFAILVSCTSDRQSYVGSYFTCGTQHQ